MEGRFANTTWLFLEITQSPSKVLLMTRPLSTFPGQSNIPYQLSLERLLIEISVHRLRIQCGENELRMIQASVVQLGLTGGPFYKNVDTCGALLTKWCVKQQIQDLKLKREDKWARHWNYHTIANSILLQIAISAMPVVEASLTLSFLYQTQYDSCSK